MRHFRARPAQTKTTKERASLFRLTLPLYVCIVCTTRDICMCLRHYGRFQRQQFAANVELRLVNSCLLQQNIFVCHPSALTNNYCLTGDGWTPSNKSALNLENISHQTSDNYSIQSLEKATRWSIGSLMTI